MLALEAIENAQFLRDARWAGVAPWDLAGCAPDVGAAQRLIWREWIRVVRVAEINAENYHRSKAQGGSR